MGGEGSMLSAIKTLKQNRALLKKRKLRELKDVLYAESGKTELEFTQISPKELDALKFQIREKAKKARITEIFIYLASIIVTFLIFWGLYVLLKY